MRCAKAKCVVLGGHVCGRVVVVILAQSTVGAEAGGNERTKGVGGGGVALFLCWGVGHDGCFFCDDNIDDVCARWIRYHDKKQFRRLYIGQGLVNKRQSLGAVS